MTDHRERMIIIHQLKYCPSCRRQHSMATPVDVPSPKEGDFALCVRCGEWAAFTASGDLRKPGAPDLEKMLAEYDRYSWMKKLP